MIYEEILVLKKNTKQQFLGEGSYGCVIKPGYDCNGKVNKGKKNVTKITEINFASKNELYILILLKKLNLIIRIFIIIIFVPIIKKCIVNYNIFKNFDINKCNNFLDNIYSPFNSYNNLFKNQFFCLL